MAYLVSLLILYNCVAMTGSWMREQNVRPNVKIALIPHFIPYMVNIGQDGNMQMNHQGGSSFPPFAPPPRQQANANAPIIAAVAVASAAAVISISATPMATPVATSVPTTTVTATTTPAVTTTAALTCEPNPCQNNGQCMSLANIFVSCSCFPGFCGTFCSCALVGTTCPCQ